MKLKNILPIIALGAFAFQACDDEKMDWFNPHEGNGVTTSEMPLALAEQISRYNVIKSYIPREDFVIGLGMGMDIYMSSEEYRNIVNANFNSVTTGNAMKMSSIVNAKGERDFSKVDAFLNVLPQDMALYGHNLIWHTQQAATYLKNLIAPTIDITEDGTSNLLPNGSFENEFTGWNKANVSGTAEIVDETSAIEGSKVLKLVNTNTDGYEYKMQIQGAFPVPWEAEEEYDISLWVKSESAGTFRISFTNDVNNYSDCHYQNQETTSAVWKQYTYTIKAGFTSGAKETGISLDFGKTQGIYYVDDVKISRKVEANLLPNGSFENEFTGWNKANVSGTAEVIDEASAINGSKVLKLVNTNTDGYEYKMQIQGAFSVPWEAEEEYDISLWVKSEGAGTFRISSTNDGTNNYDDCHYLNQETTSAVWKQYTYTIKAGFTSGAKEAGISLDFGKTQGTYYVDDVKVIAAKKGTTVQAKSVTRGIVITEKTEEQKKEIITNAMEAWIKDMVGHYKTRVHAWDVLNEPIDDGGKLRGVEVTPDESTMDNDDFYWGKYMGKDYAVNAFKWAREADPTAKLYINDYNLEYSPNKLAKLLEYVKYIEENGAQVDGIGTQMHIDIDIDKSKIADMFTTLAATQKLIRITELDIKVKTSSPTTANLATQAALYQYVIDKYKEIIPEAQQAGITIWTLSDNADEHTYWIPNDAPNIFDAKYARKHAYKGVCDGLAGKDVGAEFPGDLQ